MWISENTGITVWENVCVRAHPCMPGYMMFSCLYPLQVYWSRKEEEGVFWKRSGIEEIGCELVLTMKAVGFLWLKMERLISFRAQHTPPGVLITALERGSGHFFVVAKQTNSACFCSPDLRSIHCISLELRGAGRNILPTVNHSCTHICTLNHTHIHIRILLRKFYILTTFWGFIV